MIFYLVRHGQKQPTPFDPPLTQIGLLQAKATARALQTTPFQTVLASPKNRTMQTAESIVANRQISISKDVRLQERMEWESNETFAEFIAEWNKTDSDRSYIPRHGMSSERNGKQIGDVLTALEKRYDTGNILIVTHGGSIGDLLRHLFPKDDLKHITEPVSGATYIEIHECSITKIEKTDEGYMLLSINDIHHLVEPLT